MKDSIVAYVTAMVNDCERKINRLQEVDSSLLTVKYYEDFMYRLSDLLDFIEDIPEVKASKDTKGLNEIIGNLECNLESAQFDNKVLKATVEGLNEALRGKSDLEQYRGFIEAVKAKYGQDAAIKCEYRNSTHSYRNKGSGLLDENGMGIVPAEILEGKWTIEGEEE